MAAHALRTGWHSLTPRDGEKFALATHASHTRSAVAEPGVSCPKPAAQVPHAVLAVMPEEDVKVPGATSPHTRSDEALEGEDSKVPATQVAMALHTRSAWLCGAVEVYWPLGQVALCVAHVRSRPVVGAAVSYSSASHVRTGLQGAPLFSSENVTPELQGAHTRSFAGEPGV